MSCDFVVDTGQPEESAYTRIWLASHGVWRFVIETIRDTVPDRELATALQDFLDGRYRYFALSFYDEPWIEQMVSALRGPLIPAAEREPWTLDPAGIVDHIRSLVNGVNDWLEEVNQHRRATGQRPLGATNRDESPFRP